MTRLDVVAPTAGGGVSSVGPKQVLYSENAISVFDSLTYSAVQCQDGPSQKCQLMSLAGLTSVTLLAGKCQHLTAYLRTIADDYALTATDSRPDASIDHGPTNSRRYEQQTDDHIGGWAANTPLTADKYIQVQCVHRHSSTSTDSFPEGDVSQ